MFIMTTVLALAAGTQATPATTAAPPGDHVQHQQMAKEHDAKGCPCCEHTAGKKMACCEKHEKTESGKHAGHSGA